MADDPAAPEPPPARRDFLKVATCAIGGGLGLVVAAPALRLIVAPGGMQTVTTPTDPIDIGAVADVKISGAWQKLDVIAPVIKDAWTAARDVVLGAAFVRRPAEGKVEALSSVCPHLGCAVGWDAAAGSFLCPCHNSRWNPNGELMADSKAKRGLDPLPIEVKDGRLRLTWQLYKLDTDAREPA